MVSNTSWRRGGCGGPPRQPACAAPWCLRSASVALRTPPAGRGPARSFGQATEGRASDVSGGGALGGGGLTSEETALLNGGFGYSDKMLAHGLLDDVGVRCYKRYSIAHFP